MLPLLLYTAGLVGSVLGFAKYVDHRDKKLREEYEKEFKKYGGRENIDSVELVSINYKGKKKVKGRGIKVSSYADSWEEGEFELKFEAVKKGCDIILNYHKEGSVREGFSFEGIAYQKA